MFKINNKDTRTTPASLSAGKDGDLERAHVGRLCLVLQKRVQNPVNYLKLRFCENRKWVKAFSYFRKKLHLIYLTAKPAITCSKLTIETLEQGVKYVQN